MQLLSDVHASVQCADARCPTARASWDNAGIDDEARVGLGWYWSDNTIDVDGVGLALSGRPVLFRGTLANAHHQLLRRDPGRFPARIGWDRSGLEPSHRCEGWYFLSKDREVVRCAFLPAYCLLRTFLYLAAGLL